MHSVFWTLAKSHHRLPAGQRRGNALSWESDVTANMAPQAVEEGAAGYSYNAFVQESTLDEIAFIGGVDPLELRRKLMSPYPAAIRLIDAVESMSDWQTPLPGGKARGFAFALSFGTWIAAIVEISGKEAGIRIEKAFCAADSGFVRDERSFRAHLTSAVRAGLSHATGADGSPARHEPEIEVDLLRGATHPGGSAKLIVPPVVPALANAVFALTGKRLRSVPLSDEVAFV
jgi:isoquinoline 1-oxidoreductase beta subunit